MAGNRRLVRRQLDGAGLAPIAKRANQVTAMKTAGGRSERLDPVLQGARTIRRSGRECQRFVSRFWGTAGCHGRTPEVAGRAHEPLSRLKSPAKRLPPPVSRGTRPALNGKPACRSRLHAEIAIQEAWDSGGISIAQAQPVVYGRQQPHRTDQQEVQILEEGWFGSFDLVSDELTDPSRDEQR